MKMDFYILHIVLKIHLEIKLNKFYFYSILYKMSKLLNDNSGIGPRYSTSYVMLNDYCKNNTSLGVSSVAPIYAPYNVNPAVQDVPVFKGTNYDEAPYMNPLLFCGACGGNYCNALAGYHWPVDKAGNPLPDAKFSQGKLVSGYSPVSYVQAGPNDKVLLKNGVATVMPRK